MTTTIGALLCFLSGSLMFSYWLGLLAKRNIRDVGDGNPGGVNLWKSAGYKYGLTGIALDFLKGYLPLLWLSGNDAVPEYGLMAAAAAAIMGHMFSPFLKWRGGKAIAVTFGVWSALTGFAGSLAYAIILVLLILIFRLYYRGRASSPEMDGFQVVLGMLLLSIYLIGAHGSQQLFAFWFVNLLLLAWSHRHELQRVFAFSSKRMP